MTKDKLKQLFWLFIFLSLLYRLFISWNTFIYVDNIFLVDDSYYCLNISRNIALGNGALCDGIHQTNGFQPLYVLLMVPLYLVFPDDRIMPIHIALTFLSLCNIAIGILIFKLVRNFTNYKAALFSFFLWSFSPYCLTNGINGMETSLAGLLFLLSIYYYIIKIKCAETYSRKRFIYVGCILGLAMLTRIDQLFLLFVICCDRLWFYCKEYEKCDLRDLSLELFLMVFFSSLLYAPWGYWSYINFGTVIPQSGEAIYNISLLNFSTFKFKYLLFYLTGIIATIIFMVDMLLPVCRLILCYFSPQIKTIFLVNLITYIVFLSFLYFYIKPFFVTQPFFLRQIYSRIKPFSFLGIFVLIFFLSYVFRVGGWWYFERYYYPVFILLILFLGLTFPLFSHPVIPNKIALKNQVSKFICIGMYMVSVILFLMLTLFFRPENTTAGYCKPSQWVNEHLDEKVTLGAFQSGAMSYFVNNRTVINLDGVVNYQVLDAIRSKKFINYIRSQKIKFIIDWKAILQMAYNNNLITDNDITWRKTIPSLYSGTQQLQICEVIYP